MKKRIQMNRWLVFVYILIGVFAACATSADGQQFALKDGDSVVFYGDSITAQRLYTRFVEEFVLTRYPDTERTLCECRRSWRHCLWWICRRHGRAGSTRCRALSSRLHYRDAGNERWWIRAGVGEKSNAVFQKGYRELLDSLHRVAPGAVITLITPTPYDEITHGTEFPNVLAGDCSKCRGRNQDWRTVSKPREK